MGKGDKKSRRGKIHIGSFGVRRKKRKNTGAKVSTLKAEKVKKAPARIPTPAPKEPEIVAEPMIPMEPAIVEEPVVIKEPVVAEEPVKAALTVSEPVAEPVPEPQAPATEAPEPAPAKKTTRKAPAKKATGTEEPAVKEEKETKPKTPRTKKKPEE